MKKPYLVTIFSDNNHERQAYYDGLKRYRESISLLENSAEYIPVYCGSNFPGFPGRWKFIPKDLDPDRWIIFTDISDVIFQQPIPDLDATGKSILVAPEGIKFKDNSFWVDHIRQLPKYESVLEEAVYNNGCWAAKGYEMMEFVERVTAPQVSDVAIPTETPEWILWLKSKGDKVGVLPGLFMALYANYEKGNCKKENGVWKTKDDQIISIVHANGATKELL